MRSLFFLLVPLFTLATAQAKVVEPKVLFVVIDGIRDLEWLGKSKNDSGKFVSATDLFPHLLALKKKGAFFPEMHVSNPAGVSLPGYADIFAGRRQEKIVNNHPAAEDMHSHYPTVFQTVNKTLNLGSDAVAVHASWAPICSIAMTNEKDDGADFYRSCGWKEGKYLKPELYKGSRTDMDTFVEFMREVPKRHPRFMFLHLVDADEEGHFHTDVEEKAKVYYGIFNYHKALREDDYYVGRVWEQLQSDPFYRDSTTLIVTTDHGRDNWPDPTQWAEHGTCVKYHGAKVLCSGCSHIFGIAVGPGIKPRTVKTAYTHLDFAPTIAKIFKAPLPTATGHVIREIVSE